MVIVGELLFGRILDFQEYIKLKQLMYCSASTYECTLTFTLKAWSSELKTSPAYVGMPSSVPVVLFR